MNIYFLYDFNVKFIQLSQNGHGLIPLWPSWLNVVFVCFKFTSTNSISLHQNIGLNILDRDDKLSNFSNPRRFNLYSDIQCLMVCSSDKGLVVQRILLLDIDLGQLKFSLSLRRGYILQLGCELWSHQETWKLLLLHLKLYNQFSLSPRIISPFQSPFKAHIKQSMKIL